MADFICDHARRVCNGDQTVISTQHSANIRLLMRDIGIGSKDVTIPQIIMLPLMFVHMVRASVNNKTICSKLQARNKIHKAVIDGKY